MDQPRTVRVVRERAVADALLASHAQRLVLDDAPLGAHRLEFLLHAKIVGPQQVLHDLGTREENVRKP